MTFRSRIWVTAGAVFAVYLAAAVAQSDLLTVRTGKRDVLLQTTASWNGKPYTRYAEGQPQLTMIKLTIPPHTALPWHTHPVPNAIYVLSGRLTLHDRASGVTKVLLPGDAVGESVDDEHRGETGEEPAVLLITYAGVAAMPTTVPAKGEKPEY